MWATNKDLSELTRSTYITSQYSFREDIRPFISKNLKVKNKTPLGQDKSWMAGDVLCASLISIKIYPISIKISLLIIYNCSLGLFFHRQKENR